MKRQLCSVVLAALVLCSLVTPSFGKNSSDVVKQYEGEVVGVFSGYDWAQRLAVISPGLRAQKLLEEYAPTTKP